MGTVQVYTAARMKQIEDASVVGAALSGFNLTFTKFDGSIINVGNVRGPTGAPGTDGLPGIDGVDGVGLLPIALGGSVDLNAVTSTGNYVQAANANAATGTNYPQPYAGLLEVISSNANQFIWQRYTLYQTYGSLTYSRTKYNATWTAWTATGYRNYSAMAVASASVSAVAAATDIPDATITVPVQSVLDKYFVTAAIDVQVTGTTSTFFVGALSVNGVEQSAQVIWSGGGTTGARGTAYQQWEIAGLAAGNRIFKLTARRSGGLDNMVRSNTQHTTLRVSQTG